MLTEVAGDVAREVTGAVEGARLAPALGVLSAYLGGEEAVFVLPGGGEGENRTLVGGGGLGRVVISTCRNDRAVCAVRTNVWCALSGNPRVHISRYSSFVNLGRLRRYLRRSWMCVMLLVILDAVWIKICSCFGDLL